MRPRERCYVSHGHADHAREHAVVVTSVNNAKICRHRFGRKTARQPRLFPEAAAKPECTYEEHRYNEPWSEGEHQLTIFSAGHVLGSSQLMIEGERGRFVYTGDFKVEHSYSAEPIEIKRCDVVLMECTYGRPQYVFPPRAEIAGEMISFAREALEGGAIPVFYAYSLGKAQEAMAILASADLPMTVHGAVHAIAQIYEESGVRLGTYSKYDAETFEGETALIWPPSGKHLPKAVRGKAVRTAILTGWTIDGGASYRYGTDRGFPLSDHADFPSLFAYIEQAQPEKVILNHVWKDFVYRLRRQGINAEYLEANQQLTLFSTY